MVDECEDLIPWLYLKGKEPIVNKKFIINDL